jgi:hypothetical protein
MHADSGEGGQDGDLAADQYDFPGCGHAGLLDPDCVDGAILTQICVVVKTKLQGCGRLMLAA